MHSCSIYSNSHFDWGVSLLAPFTLPVFSFKWCFFFHLHFFIVLFHALKSVSAIYLFIFFFLLLYSLFSHMSLFSLLHLSDDIVCLYEMTMRLTVTFTTWLCSKNLRAIDYVMHNWKIHGVFQLLHCFGWFFIFISIAISYRVNVHCTMHTYLVIHTHTHINIHTHADYDSNVCATFSRLCVQLNFQLAHVHFTNFIFRHIFSI